eukprot:3602285-Rhodomonas_salina.1
MAHGALRGAWGAADQRSASHRHGLAHPLHPGLSPALDHHPETPGVLQVGQAAQAGAYPTARRVCCARMLTQTRREQLEELSAHLDSRRTELATASRNAT